VFIYSKAESRPAVVAWTRPVRWHAVEIVARSACCGAARGCTKRRFLSSAAPRLPLAECDAGRYDCRYRHFTDRRQDDRREHQPLAGARAQPAAERRQGRGRRATD
jgi:hypothetical protein